MQNEEKTAEKALQSLSEASLEDSVAPDANRSSKKSPQGSAEKAKRRGNPLWKAGKSGNPNGRPKGSKNKLTLLRQAVLEDAEHIVLDKWVSLVEKTIELAEQGDTTCLKILWDRVIPSKRAIDGEKADKGSSQINIVISGLEVKQVEDITEADFEEIENV